MKRMGIMALAALLALSAGGCAGVKDLQDLGKTRLDRSGTTVSEEEGTAAMAPEEESGLAAGEAEEPAAPNETRREDMDAPSYPVGQKGDPYILPDAQSHVYTRNELSGLTREELRLARNEIYARHGRIFKSSDLNAYFLGKPWYEPSVQGDAFDAGVLNQTERDNLKQIQQMEEGRSAGTILCEAISAQEYPKVNGSTATLPLSQALYRLATGASQKEAESSIRHDKTTQAYMDLSHGQGASLVIAYAPAKSVDTDNLIIKPIGRDALVFMANESNPVKSLSQRQIRDIYTGKIKSWKELDGADREIKAFQRPEKSGSQNLMEKLVMRETPMASAPQDYVMSEMGELLEKVSAYDNTGEALGYSVYYYAKNMYSMPELKFMAVDGVIPSNETIRDKSYPFVNDFYAAVRKDEPKDSKAYQLFEWLTSDDGQALINALGYVGIKDVEKPLPAGFDESGRLYTAQIPLPDGHVLIGVGQSLYGEDGIAVFDRRMRLLKFIRHAAVYEESGLFMECPGNSCLGLQDTISGKCGIYSLKEDRWVCEPVYNYVYTTPDGFVMSRCIESKEGEAGFLYDYMDRKGNLIRTSDEYDPGFEELSYMGKEEFVSRYPELLRRYGAGEDHLTMYSTEYQDTIAIIKKGNQAHYYDLKGRLLFDHELRQEENREDVYSYPTVINDHLATLSVYGSVVTRDYIYRDNVLIKELTSDQASGSVGQVGDNYYTRNIGNYIYVYNYQDQVCAKFLSGDYTDD